MNKELKNLLNAVASHLDTADGALYNAAEGVHFAKRDDLTPEQSAELDKIVQALGSIDISAVTSVKNSVNEVLEKL